MPKELQQLISYQYFMVHGKLISIKDCAQTNTTVISYFRSQVVSEAMFFLYVLFLAVSHLFGKVCLEFTIARLEDLPSPTCFTITTNQQRYVVDSAKFWNNDSKKRRVFRYESFGRYMPDAAMWEATTRDPQFQSIHIMNVRTTSFMYASSDEDSVTDECRNVFLKSNARETEGNGARFLFYYNITNKSYRIQNLASREFLQNIPASFEDNLAIICLDRRGTIEKGAESSYEFWLKSCDNEYIENKKIAEDLSQTFG